MTYPKAFSTNANNWDQWALHSYFEEDARPMYKHTERGIVFQKVLK